MVMVNISEFIEALMASLSLIPFGSVTVLSEKVATLKKKDISGLMSAKPFSMDILCLKMT